jgi:hypothetical protein
MASDKTPSDRTKTGEPSTAGPLKLVALDEEDLAVISAHVQDAVVKADEIVWSPARKQFSVPMNRFAWERTIRRRRRRGSDERRRSILHFARVEAVRSTGFSPTDKEAVLAVLAVVFEETEAPAGTITIVCAGDAAIRLDVECIEAQLTDLGSAWEASMRPKHHLGWESN